MRTNLKDGWSTHEAIRVHAVEVVPGTLSREVAGESRGSVANWRDVAQDEGTVANGWSEVGRCSSVGLTASEKVLHHGGGSG